MVEDYHRTVVVWVEVIARVSDAFWLNNDRLHVAVFRVVARDAWNLLSVRVEGLRQVAGADHTALSFHQNLCCY